MIKKYFALMMTVSLAGLAAFGQGKDNMQELETKIRSVLNNEKGVFAVALVDIGSGRHLFINEKESFHAASTMKTPVMIEVYKQVAKGLISLSDSVLIQNRFYSIVDNSPYSLNPDDDSEKDLYLRLGTKATLTELLYKMITVSSNLSTNLIISLVGAKNVSASMQELGAGDIHVMRGVEDSKAFEQGMNNTVTAFDLMLLFEKMAKGQLVSHASSMDMIRILLDQQFNEIIPANLPASVKVAHKTGSINGTEHDSGIVFLPDGRQYVLVILSKNLTDTDAAVKAMARVSGLVYQHLKS